jgi:hypothetical protein
VAQDSAADALYDNSTQEHLLEKSSLADQHADFVLLFQKLSIFSKLQIMLAENFSAWRLASLPRRPHRMVAVGPTKTKQDSPHQPTFSLFSSDALYLIISEP